MSGFHSQANAAPDGGHEDRSDPSSQRFADPGSVESELRALRAQAQQARTIVADAVGKLGDSFGSMQADTAAQRAVMQALLSTLAEPSHGVAQAEDVAVGIRQFIGETSAVLRQFTDMLATVSAQSMKTVYRIDDMAAQLEGVFKLVASINEISQETFILAVNATIEAAHAGQAGRTFAVIASNVRDLSQRTKRFNDEIGTQIGKAQGTINEVRQIVAEMASRDLNVALTGKERVQSMLPNLEAFRTTVADSVALANEAGGRIAASTSAAVTALQFEDITSQLIGSMVKRAERIAGGVLDAADGPATLVPSSVAARGEPRDSAGSARLSSDPVHQQDMSPGDVELF